MIVEKKNITCESNAVSVARVYIVIIIGFEQTSYTFSESDVWRKVTVVHHKGT